MQRERLRKGCRKKEERMRMRKRKREERKGDETMRESVCTKENAVVKNRERAEVSGTVRERKREKRRTASNIGKE